MDTLGSVDINKNLSELNTFPELYRDDVRSTYKQEAKHEAARDEDQEILDRMTGNKNEAWEFITTYMLDESPEALYLALKEASKKGKPDLCEIGRLFMESFNGCIDSYLSLHREG